MVSIFSLDYHSVLEKLFSSGYNLLKSEEDTMEQFENATIVKKANIYFEGKVTSRTVLLAGGERKTLGIMLPGDYEFGTGDKEVMEILGGKLEVLLPGSTEWLPFTEGSTFEVPANSSFKLKVKELTDYCCSYIKTL